MSDRVTATGRPLYPWEATGSPAEPAPMPIPEPEVVADVTDDEDDLEDSWSLTDSD